MFDMCGIIGIINATHTLYNEKRKVMEALLLLNRLRGGDGCGLGWRRNGSLNIIKLPISGDIALAEFQRQAVLQNVELYDFIIGHDRKKTRGTVSYESTQPFTFNKDFMGVHNGTVNGAFQGFSSDSQKLLWEINQKGPDVLKDVDGAFSLVWYDSKAETLFICNNGERDLWYGYLPDESIVFASEKIFIEFACFRNLIKLKNMKQFKPDILYEIPLKGKQLSIKETPMEFGKTAVRTIAQGYIHNQNYRSMPYEPWFRLERIITNKKELVVVGATRYNTRGVATIKLPLDVNLNPKITLLRNNPDSWFRLLNSKHQGNHYASEGLGEVSNSSCFFCNDGPGTESLVLGEEEYNYCTYCRGQAVAISGAN